MAVRIQSGTNAGELQLTANGLLPVVMVSPDGNPATLEAVVSNEVEVKNDVGNPLFVNISNGEVEIKNDLGNPVPVGIVGTPSVSASQSGTWSVGRTWTTNSATDSIAASQQGTWTVGATQSGAWTVGRNWLISDTNESIQATQKGTWSVGRTWNLTSANDSVAATVSGSVAITGTPNVNIGSNGIVDLAKGGTAANPYFQAISQAGAAAAKTNPVPVFNMSSFSNQAASFTAAAGAAVTATLNTQTATNTIYISKIVITMYNTAARTGGATPVTVTTTNLSVANSLSFIFPSAGAVGTIVENQYDFSGTPLLAGSGGGTSQISINCPAAASVIWRVSIYYREGGPFSSATVANNSI